MKGPGTGYYFRAIRDSEQVASALGINTVRQRIIATMLSAFFTAIAGTFYSQYVLYIDPESVTHHALSVEIVMVARSAVPAPFGDQCSELPS